MDLANGMNAFWAGIVSAISLPLGAAMGLWLKPSNKWTSSLMAFGAGALLMALTMELVVESMHKAGFWPLASGFIMGALLFMGLNSLLNGHGAFLRKSATTVGHLSKKKRKHCERILEGLSRIDILRALPPEEVQSLVPLVHPNEYKKGDVVCFQDDAGDMLYLLESGKVEVLRSEEGKQRSVAQLGPGDSFGEMALLTGEPRSATVKVLEDSRILTLDKDDFDRLRAVSPGLNTAVSDLLSKRLGTKEQSAAAWASIAKANLSHAVLAPTPVEIKKAHSEGGAPMAIWLGILLDGIPESLVIGASMIGTGKMSLPLIVGVFLANFPEALSSGVGMKKGGFSTRRIIWMWTSLTLMTGIGAFIGFYTFEQLPVKIFAVVEGLAAGAMLAMIAETMLPEATEQGGPAPGLMTVLGFLAALYVGSLGGH